MEKEDEERARLFKNLGIEKKVWYSGWLVGWSVDLSYCITKKSSSMRNWWLSSAASLTGSGAASVINYEWLLRTRGEGRIGRKKERTIEKQDSLPFWRISRCSHRISPMKGGVRARKFSLPMAHMSRPRMRKCCSTTPSSENSLMAQLSQRDTSASDHKRGSVCCWFLSVKNKTKQNQTETKLELCYSN